MNTFLERIRSSVIQPEVSETRFLSTSKKVTASSTTDLKPAVLKSTASLIKQFGVESVTHLTKSGQWKITFEDVSASSLTDTLDTLEPVLAAAGWARIEATYNPNDRELNLEMYKKAN